MFDFWTPRGECELHNPGKLVTRWIYNSSGITNSSSLLGSMATEIVAKEGLQKWKK
jgi:hypothetical protein